MKHIIISFIGPDRSGLVDTLSQIVNQHKGNWQVSSMHHLSGFFAGVIEVAVQEKNTTALITDLKAIEGLSCQIETAAAQQSEDNTNLVLELTANDRVGIVQEISSVIHHQGGNLVKLVSSQNSAAHSGQIMFKAKAQIAVNNEKIDGLITALESIADDLMVDISR